MAEVFRSGVSSEYKTVITVIKNRFSSLLPENGSDYCGFFFCLMLSIFSSRKLLLNAAVFFGIPLLKYSVFLYYTLVLFVFYKSLPEIRKRLNGLDAAFFLFFSLSLIASVLFYDSDPVLKAEIFKRYFTVCCLSYFAARALELTEKNLKYMRIFAYLIIINELIQLFVFRLYPFRPDSALLMLGTAMISSFILLIIPIVRDIKVCDGIVWILILFITTVSASRGAFIIILSTTAVAVLYGSRSKRMIAALFSVYCGAAVVFLVWREKIIATLYAFYFSQGFPYKFFILSDQNNFIINKSTDERFKIWRWCLDFIGSHIFCGGGIVNERHFIRELMLFPSEMLGAYPHNFFLEICTQFGLVPGLLILLAGAYILIKGFVRSSLSVDRIFVVILVMTSLGHLMVSGSYIQDTLFFAFVGFVTHVNSKESSRCINLI